MTDQLSTPAPAPKKKRHRGVLGWIQRRISGCDHCETGLLVMGQCDTCGRWDSAP